MAPLEPVDTPDFPRSQAVIGRHPIHPMLITFPIAFLVGALLSDLTFALSRDVFWVRASYILLLAGLISGVIAALVGSLDFWGNSRIRAHRAAWFHMIGNSGALLLALANILTRANTNFGAVLTEGLILSFVTVLVLMGSGWFGGELVFKHRVGVDQPGAG